MPHYLISVHMGEAPPQHQAEMTPEDRERSFAAMQELEADMRREGAWVFSGRLDQPKAATVVEAKDGDVLTTDGPFAEAKEYIAGFYIIEAADLDAALGWAGRTSEVIRQPLEVRPFQDVQID